MSVSLTLIPVALAIRAVMGKENFDQWVNSMQIKVPTNFENERDLVSAVKKAGYDAEKWGSNIKTHIRGEQAFFFWQRIDGKWVAVFSKSDSKEMITQFIRDLESKSGQKIFAVSQETNMPEVIPMLTFPTNFRDGELLMKALIDYGTIPFRHPSGEITCTLGQATLRFRPVADEPFNIEIENAPDANQIFQHILILDEDYRRQVQQQVYQNLLARAKERGFELESEEVQKDNSIILTLTF